MAQAQPEENRFVVDLLTTLRDEKFSLPAWARFLGRSWEMSCRTANDNPGLKRSWQRVSLLLGTLALALILGSFIIEGPSITLRLLPGFVFCVAWQTNDLFWHLGLNRESRTGKLYPVLGLANTLTQARGVAASYLLGRLIGGVPTPTVLALLLFLSGIVTDILDGQVARRAHTRSFLGQLTDGEADLCLYLAITLVLIQHNILPLWLGIVMLARFLVPLLAALASYFLYTHRIHFGSTTWGKLAGLAQSLYFCVLLAPAWLATITRFINLPLLIATVALLVAAPIAQIMANVNDCQGDREGAPLQYTHDEYNG